MRSLIIASLLCSPVLLCEMETPLTAEGSLLEPTSIPQIKNDVVGKNKKQVQAYFGRRGDQRSDGKLVYFGEFREPGNNLIYRRCIVSFLTTPPQVCDGVRFTN